MLFCRGSWVNQFCLFCPHEVSSTGCIYQLWRHQAAWKPLTSAQFGALNFQKWRILSGMLCHDAACLALELETLAYSSFHLARSGDHKICLLSVLWEGNMRNNSIVVALVFITCILETSWASLQPEMRLCLCETFRSCAYIIMASTGH